MSLRYIGLRLLQMIATVLGIMSILFVLLRASGDPAVVAAGPAATPEIVEAMRAQMGLDRPLYVQYALFLKGLVRLDFGDSFTFNQPALAVVLHVLPASLAIVLPAIVISSTFGVGIGAYAAVSRRAGTARALMVSTFLGNSVPFFWLGMILILVFALLLRLLPPGGTGGVSFVILPIATMALSHIATFSRLTFGEVREASRQLYVTMARSKGLTPLRILVRHILPNALPPIFAWMGIVFAFSLGQLLIIEPLFAYRGLGAIMVQGVQAQDFPIVSAGVFIVALLVSTGNLLTDLASRWLDPGLSGANS